MTNPSKVMIIELVGRRKIAALQSAVIPERMLRLPTGNPSFNFFKFVFDGSWRFFLNLLMFVSVCRFDIGK